MEEGFASGILEENLEDCPVKTVIKTLDLNPDQPVTLTLTQFSNKTLLICSETGKTSVFYQVQKLGETVRPLNSQLM